MACLKKMFNGEITTFKKETEKIVSLQMKSLVHFYHPPVILFARATKYCSVLCRQYSEKEQIEGLYFSEGK